MARRNQAEIPGTERFHDEDLSAAIEDLQELRAKRTQVKADLDATAERLQEMMVAKGIKEYVDPELRAKVTLADSTKLSLTEFKVKETTVEE